ncbi:MAG TPA: hypothetical protein VMR50_02015 [Myxococcota bacterium]|nr:hypothetical protein [Myxococcota bacterium]
MTKRSVRGLALPLACISLFGLARSAGAQESIHSVSINMKAVAQATNTGGDRTAAKSTVNDASIFEACVGQAPTKTQTLDLDFLDCTDLSNNLVNAVDGPNFDIVLGGIGAFMFEMDRATFKSSGGDTVQKSAQIPVLVSIECVAPDASITLSGIANITFKPFGGTFCPETVKVKLTGFGMTTANPAFLANDGSSAHSKRVVDQENM